MVINFVSPVAVSVIQIVHTDRVFPFGPIKPPLISYICPYLVFSVGIAESDRICLRKSIFSNCQFLIVYPACDSQRDLSFRLRGLNRYLVNLSGEIRVFDGSFILNNIALKLNQTL